jgi:hypothetical protein
MARVPNRLLLALIIGFIAGVVWLVAVRFITYESDAVHYHANFAVYINGQRETFDNFTFYEEVASCNADELGNPKTRVHMHDKVNHVVHVHDNAATWGHFFANLGYALGNDVIKTDKGTFVSGTEEKALRFILNGNESESIANQTIRSEDVLLIDFGEASTPMLMERYDDIKRDAGEYNQRDDPSSCKGNKHLSFGERLKIAIGIGD